MICKFRELREASGMSQAEFIRKSGIPRRSIQNWEYGDIKQNYALHLHKAAKTLGCTIDDLFDFSDEDSETPGT